MSALSKKFKGIADISYDADNEAILITPTSAAFMAIALTAASGELSSFSWHEMTDSLDKASENYYEAGLHASLNLINPENSKNVLYSCYDGTTVYDVLEDE